MDKNNLVVKKLIQMQYKLSYLKDQMLLNKYNSINKDFIYKKELSKVCGGINLHISVFNNGLLKLLDHSNFDAHNNNFIDLMSPQSGDVKNATNNPKKSLKNENDLEDITDVKRLPYNEIQLYYKDSHFSVIRNGVILVLSKNYDENAIVLVKQVPDMKLLGYFVVDEELKASFKENYFIALDKLLNSNDDISVLMSHRDILNELFMQKTLQFEASMQRLSTLLNVDCLNSDANNKKLTFDVLNTFNSVFYQMRDTLVECAENISAIS